VSQAPSRHKEAPQPLQTFAKQFRECRKTLQLCLRDWLIFKQAFNIAPVSNTAHLPRRRRPRLRSRGRPPVDTNDDVRSALLDAANKLFLKHGFERVTARQIAVAAGTTAAMIHYYFGNKLGLFRAMLERAIGPVRELIAGSLAQAGAVVDPEVLIRMHMQTAAANPWIATLIVNEVLAEKGRFRATFIRDVAGRQAPLVMELLQRARTGGKLREDLDVRLAALSLLSLCMFPFLARAVAGPVLGLKYDDEEIERLIAHTAKLFTTGTLPAARATRLEHRT
jgi:TetR/AcrR family transcriptional regulator